MQSSQLPFLFVLAAAPVVGAQSPVNPVLPSNGGDVVVVLGNPSQPGDATYTGVPANRVRSASGTVDVSGLANVFLGTVDWPAGAPDFYDVGFGTSSAATAFDPLVPDVFTNGSIAALLSLGNSGFPHPCVAQPTSTCTSSAACPPLVSGYTVDITLSSPIPLPAPPSDVDGLSIVQFLPPGMTYLPSAVAGSCGQGDYVFQGMLSTDEAQADYLNVAGASWADGLRLGSGAPTPFLSTAMLEVGFALADPVVEPLVTDPVAGVGPERGGVGLGVDTSSGAVTLQAYVTTDPSLAGSFVYPACSTAALPVPLTVFDAQLLLSPTPLFTSTLAAWAGTGQLQALPVGPTTPRAEAVSPPIAVPPLTNQRVHLQAFVVTGIGTITAIETTSWALDLR